MITANKGEWSELYVLFKLLGEKKIHAGDGRLNRLATYYPVLKIIRDELERHMEYTLAGENRDIVIVSESGEEIARINALEFLGNATLLFEGIQGGAKGQRAFEIPTIDDFLRKIHCQKIKAKSQDKADIHIVIHDYHTGMQPNLGFSIKSDAGASPTLLNASKPTTLVYEVSGKGLNESSANEINGIEGSRWLQDRVKAIFGCGFTMKPASVPNEVFYNNLQMVDCRIPEILSWLLADCYANGNMRLSDAVERIREANPLGFNLSLGHDHYGYKVKSFLTAIALGMLPAKPWSGQYEATGGYIVVKNDGDVICFHLFERNLLEDYLFNNTKFETPDHNRYDLGEIYKTGDRFFFNLVLQIRFI